MFSLTSTGIHADQFQTTAGLEFFWIGILFVFFTTVLATVTIICDMTALAAVEHRLPTPAAQSLPGAQGGAAVLF